MSARTTARRLQGGRRWRLRAALCFALLAAVSSPAWAALGVACQAERAGERAVVSVTLADVLDSDLRRLVELGLAGRLHMQVTLHRRRAFWFDAQVAEQQRQSVLAWSRSRATMLLDGRPVDPARLVLPMVLRPAGGTLDAGAHYLEVTVRLEVVTASSLGAVARWLVAGRPGGGAGREGEEGDSGPVPLLPRALAGALASDLARTARGRCDLPPPRPVRVSP